MGRSVRRAVRIAVSDGRPSRRKNPPGILPAAYMRSSTSIVSGKKSIPSRGCAVVQVARTCVSPYVTTHEPSACWASLPDSNVRVVFPNSRERLMAIGRCLLVSGCAARSRRAAGEVGAGPVVSGEPPILEIGGSLLRTDRGERPPPVPISDPFASLLRRKRPTGRLGSTGEDRASPRSRDTARCPLVAGTRGDDAGGPRASGGRAGTHGPWRGTSDAG